MASWCSSVAEQRLVMGLSLAVSSLALVALGLGLNGTSSVLSAPVAELIPSHRRARLYGYFYTTNETGTVLAPLV